LAAGSGALPVVGVCTRGPVVCGCCWALAVIEATEAASKRAATSEAGTEKRVIIASLRSAFVDRADVTASDGKQRRSGCLLSSITTLQRRQGAMTGTCAVQEYHIHAMRVCHTVQRLQ
jgi:hypothetical protein